MYSWRTETRSILFLLLEVCCTDGRVLTLFSSLSSRLAAAMIDFVYTRGGFLRLTEETTEF